MRPGVHLGKLTLDAPVYRESVDLAERRLLGRLY